MWIITVLKNAGKLNEYKKKVYYIVPLLKDFGSQIEVMGDIHKYVKEKLNVDDYEVKFKLKCELKMTQKKIKEIPNEAKKIKE